MTTLRRLDTVLLLALPATASADILMLDVNIQEGERKAVQKLATEFGEDANFVVGAKTKDFLVLLEVEFAKAERGETDVTTIVFSGHSGAGREFYLTRKNEPEDTPKRLARLMNEAYFACRDAERTCTDPSRKTKQLRELYLDTEAHVRPKQSDPTLIDAIQRKVYRLYHYDDFKKTWMAKNGARVDDAARKVPGFPDAATFRAASRREQIESVSALRAGAGGDAALESLAADMQREIVELRDPQ